MTATEREGLERFFSPDYATARARFLTEAREAGGEIRSFPISGVGPAGEELAIDSASLGPAEADRAVIVSSGLHGVEGFFGSAVQLGWLARGKGLPGVRVVLIHALNPYGFAWSRRWNENNVDLNRNFLSDRLFLTNDPCYAACRRAYERLADFLNPPSPPPVFEFYTLKAVSRILRAGVEARRDLPRARRPWLLALGTLYRLGLGEIKKTIPVGQYEHPRGLFYGGEEAEATTEWVRSNLRELAGPARSVVLLDFHTGLGRWGELKLLLEVKSGDPMAARAGELFGVERLEPWDAGETAYEARGTMVGECGRLFADREFVGLTPECGTYPAPTVLAALRAENRVHHYGERGSRRYERVKGRLREVFCPASAAWRNRTAKEGIGLVVSACAGTS